MRAAVVLVRACPRLQLGHGTQRGTTQPGTTQHGATQHGTSRADNGRGARWERYVRGAENCRDSWLERLSPKAIVGQNGRIWRRGMAAGAAG